MNNKNLFESFSGRPPHPYGDVGIDLIKTKRMPAALDWLDKPLDLRETHRIASEKIDYAISPIFQAGRAALITGTGGSSKSTLLKKLAIIVTTGRSDLGLSVQKAGKAVLILAEDTAEDAHRSLEAIFQSMNLSEEEVALVHERLYIFAAAGRDCVIVSNSDSVDDKKPQRLEKLLQFIMQLGDVRLVGLDPAIALSRGRELDEVAQRDLANAVEKIAITTGASVIVISHAAKSIQFQQEIGSHASRGSGAITDAFRLELLMRVMTAKEAKSFQIDEHQRHRYVRMQVTKANSLPPELMHPAWLERINGGALKLVKLAPASVTRTRGALELFVEADPETGELVPTSMSFSTWKLKALDAGLLTGATDSARDMSARRLLATIKSSKWVVDTQGIWKPTELGVNEISR